MKPLIAVKMTSEYLRELFRGTWNGWNRFWFSPSDPATLGLIRILAGAMLFYTHLVWSLDLPGFFSAHSWLSPDTMQALPGHTPLQWSWFYWIDSPALRDRAWYRSWMRAGDSKPSASAVARIRYGHPRLDDPQ